MPARGGRRAISHDHRGRVRHDRNEPEWPTNWVDLPTPALQTRLPGATPKQPFSYNDLPTLGRGVRPSRPRNDTSSRSEEHTSELQSLMRISYAVFCLKKKKTKYINNVQQLDVV